MRLFPRLLIAFLTVSLVPLLVLLLVGSFRSPAMLRLALVIGGAAVAASVILSFSFSQPIERLFAALEDYFSKKGHTVKWHGGFPQAVRHYRELIASAAGRGLSGEAGDGTSVERLPENGRPGGSV